MHITYIPLPFSSAFVEQLLKDATSAMNLPYEATVRESKSGQLVGLQPLASLSGPSPLLLVSASQGT